MPLPARATRGKRMRQLVGEEAEADEEFWNQDFFAEGDEDNYYQFEDEDDIVDSDFDNPEEPEDETEQVVPEEQSNKSQKKVYVDATSIRALKQQSRPENEQESQFQQLVHGATSSQAPTLDQLQQMQEESERKKKELAEKRQKQREQRLLQKKLQEQEMAKQAAKPGRAVRESTREQTHEYHTWLDEEEKRKSYMKSRKKPKTKRKVRVRSQEDRLREAKIVEQQNIASLEAMQAEAELIRKKNTAVRGKKELSGPLVRFHSVPQQTTVTFTHVDQVPEIINASGLQYPPKPVCAVTGQSASYRTIQELVPYANAQVYTQAKQLEQQRYQEKLRREAEEERQRQEQLRLQQQQQQAAQAARAKLLKSMAANNSSAPSTQGGERKFGSIIKSEPTTPTSPAAQPKRPMYYESPLNSPKSALLAPASTPPLPARARSQRSSALKFNESLDRFDPDDEDEYVDIFGE